jgi:outer membrane protein TolC
MPANDGRIIRPSDEPSLARVVHNWDICLATAFARREELRTQRWNIKSIELQLKAANTLAHPQLNFVSSYQINGFGRRLFGDNLNNGSAGSQLQSMNRSLFAGDQTQWNVGLQFSVPLGYRNARAQVRNTELRLMKAYAVLDTQETEIGHELAGAFQAIEYWYQSLQTNYNRREAAAKNLGAVEADYQADRKSLDLLLQSQTRMTIADIAFYRSLTEYNKALAELQMRQGTLLEYNNIHLSEREWVPEARVDAERRAWARAYALDSSEFDSVHHEPAPVVPTRQPVMPAQYYEGPPDTMPPVMDPAEAMPDSVEILESPRKK